MDEVLMFAFAYKIGLFFIENGFQNRCSLSW